MKSASPGWSARRWLAVAAAFYAALTLLVFGGVLFSTDRLISAGWTSDITAQFYHVRSFGFGQLAQGNLPLWNPHIFAGVPYAANFQSALFYPPNWIFLAFPTAVAINWSVALHVFLAGWFTFVWLRGRELHPVACLTGGVLFMFCGPYFAFVYAGNLTNLCTMVWAPLVLWSIDGWLRSPRVQWGLTGSLVVAMQILAGHPQYVYYTALAAGVYLLLSLWRCERRLAAVTGFVVMYLAGAALAAIQLIPGLTSASQSVRAGGVPFEFAIHLSLPPENLLTFVAPGFFGTMHNTSYWGHGLLWEMTGFVGLTTLVLAAYGLWRGQQSSGRCALAATAAVTILLALGGHTPVFRLLFDYLPGFDRFRGSSKFLFAAALFVIALSTIGLDALLRRPRREWVFAGAVCGVALLLAIVGSVINASSADGNASGIWAEWLVAVRDAAQAHRELYHPADDYVETEFIRQTGAAAAAALWRAAVSAVLAAVFLAACGWERRAAYVVAALAAVEVFLFARPLAETCDLSLATMPEVQKYLAEHPGDYRIINQINPNAGSTIGALDAFGYDPGVSRRYAELMTYAAGIPLTEVSQYLRFHPQPEIPTVYQIARAQLLIGKAQEQGGTAVKSLVLNQPLPRALLVPEFQVAANREEALSLMSQPDFDPRKTVILEQDPGLSRADADETSGSPGVVRILDQSTNQLTLAATTSQPAVLLITDAYDPAWQPVPDKGVRDDFDVLPGDWAFLAIPLEAGNHTVRLEYLPGGFLFEALLSGVALVAWLVCAIWTKRRARAI